MTRPRRYIVTTPQAWSVLSPSASERWLRRVSIWHSVWAYWLRAVGMFFVMATAAVAVRYAIERHLDRTSYDGNDRSRNRRNLQRRRRLPRHPWRNQAAPALGREHPQRSARRLRRTRPRQPGRTTQSPRRTRHQSEAPVADRRDQLVLDAADMFVLFGFKVIPEHPQPATRRA
jgi:hypothetical protein